jgi:hypothetical protein
LEVCRNDTQQNVGFEPNRQAAIMRGSPKQIVFTPNSDTPYAFFSVDLRVGPIVMEVPPGPIMGAVNDLNQLWVMDFGLPGPDAGQGGTHLLLPSGYTAEVPEGYHSAQATTPHASVLLRTLPVEGDNDGAIALIKGVTFRPLDPSVPWQDTQWIDISERDADLTPVAIETSLNFWQALHRLVDEEPANEAYRNYYGELAALGVSKGQPFNPDERMRGILERAAVNANAQMRVQSFADRRPDRLP